MPTAAMGQSHEAFRDAVLALADLPSAGNVARYLAASRAVTRLKTESNRLGEQRHPRHGREHEVPDAAGRSCSPGEAAAGLPAGDRVELGSTSWKF